MGKGVGGITRALATLYLIAIHLVVIYLLVERLAPRYVTFSPTEEIRIAAPGDAQAVTTPAWLPTPEPVASAPVPGPSLDPTPGLTESSSSGGLMIPVQGVRREQLVDTFAAARAGGRVHDAIDIMAPAGTPVLAAVDGEIVKFFDSVAGGTTIYQLSTDQRFIYYYAHLQRRADDVKEGDFVRQGKTIAYVGDTGNAGAGNYHLHFSIARAIDPKRYWQGSYIDPYPYLMSGRTPDFQ